MCLWTVQSRGWRISLENVAKACVGGQLNAFLFPDSRGKEHSAGDSYMVHTYTTGNPKEAATYIYQQKNSGRTSE